MFIVDGLQLVLNVWLIPFLLEENLKYSTVMSEKFLFYENENSL
jgi:hypothetical protein